MDYGVLMTKVCEGSTDLANLTLNIIQSQSKIIELMGEYANNTYWLGVINGDMNEVEYLKSGEIRIPKKNTPSENTKK